LKDCCNNEIHVENNFVNNEIVSIQDLRLTFLPYTPSFQAEVNGAALHAMKLLLYIDTKLD